MVKSKIAALTLGILLIGYVASHSEAALNQSNWFTYTSSAQVRFIDYFDDTLHVMTSGGYLKIDPSTRAIRKLTNVNGLVAGTVGDTYYAWHHAFGNICCCDYRTTLIEDSDHITLFYVPCCGVN